MVPFALLLAVAGATRVRDLSGVTPVEKVVQMLAELQAQVEADGDAEAQTYDTFACFCSNATDLKTTAISNGEVAIDSLKADIDALASARDVLDGEIDELNTDLENHNTDLKDATAMRKSETRTFEAALLDMTKAIAALQRAIETMKATGGTSQSLVKVRSVVRPALLTARALGVRANSKVLAQLLREDPSPFADDFEQDANEYTYHSNDILGTLEQLESTFQTKKGELESADAAAQTAFNTAETAKKGQIASTEASLETKQEKRARKTGALARKQALMSEKNAVLNDDRVYLQDVVAKCEVKSKEWDQRSTMRAGEVAAIVQAVSILNTTVANYSNATRLDLVSTASSLESTVAVDPDEEEAEDWSLLQVGANSEDAEAKDYVAFLQKPHKPHHRALKAHHGSHKHARDPHAEKRAALPQAHAVVARTDKAVRKSASLSEQHMAKVRAKLVAFFRKEGGALKSPALSTLATKIGEDPFDKVKALIQGLIERLLAEEADEASHKGWCDEEIAKTTKDRDHRLRDLSAMHVEIEDLNSQKESLTHDQTELTAALRELRKDLRKETSTRTAEKAEHEQTVLDSKAGKQAVEQAIDILSHFYGEAAKGETYSGGFLQQQQVPTGANYTEAPDAFSGSYTGSQSESTGILGMLDVIQGDFARTIAQTEADEEQAKRDFVVYSRENQVSQGVKQTALDTTTATLTDVNTKLSTENSNLRSEQGLLDTAVQTWEELIPQCIADPGMTAEERVQKREAEIAALKQAYCILNDEDADCSGAGFFLQTRRH